MSDFNALDDQIPAQQYAMDNKLYVQFYNRPEKMGYKSEVAGRPIFEDIPHVRIYVPGDKTTVVDVPVTEEHRQRFPVQWEKFLKAQSQSPDGTPLEQWPQLTTSQVQEFKALNLYTVEQLANMSDITLQKFMGGSILQRKARVFLEVAAETAAAQKYATENAELKEQLAGLLATTQRLSAQIEILSQQRNVNSDTPSASNVKVEAHGNVRPTDRPSKL